jgi:L-2-hydroxycarboxylate dehydrogenase (NAD+)
MILSEAELRTISTDLLVDRGATPAGARLQADVLVEAELRGLPSHGLQRLPRLLARIDNGVADPRAEGSHDWRRETFLAVDGERGLGPVVLFRAIDALASRIATTGIVLAAIRNSNHLGMLAWYVEAAVERGLIGIAITTSEALVHPHGGTQAMLGTNPIAIGVPTGDAPFVLDLATSLVSMGKVHHHALLGKPLAKGWAVNAEGHPTTDAEAARAGAIAPFGGAKGYGLGLAIELLVASLSGGELAPDIRGTLDETEMANKGDVFILIDPEAGAGGQRLAAYLDGLRASRPAIPGQPVAVPGDGMRARREAARRRGVELPDALVRQLTALSAA